MPLLAVLSATTQIRLRINSAHLQPYDVWHRKGRRQRNVESSIRIQQGWILAVQLESLLIGEEHRHPRSIFAVIEDLLGFVPRGIEIHLRFAKHRTLSRPRLISVDRGRRDEARVRVKRLLIFSLS